MKYIYVGEIKTTHGLLGELKISSSITDKEEVFKLGNILYFGNDKIPFKINRYRKHQNYDMVTFDTLDDIDKVIKYKGYKVYITRDEINLDFINSDLINLKVNYNNSIIGVIIDVFDAGNNNYLFKVRTSKKEIYIPKNNNFIDKIDLESGIIYLKNLEAFYEN